MAGQSSTSSLEGNQWYSRAIEEQEAFFKNYGGVLYESYRRHLPSICSLLLRGYCKCFQYNDGKCINHSELRILRWKINSALGCQNGQVDAIDDTEVNGSNKLLNKIFDLITKTQQGDEILMALLYVFIEGKSEDGEVDPIAVPLFRIPNCNKGKNISEEYCFVDQSGRFYTGWNNYLKNNKLPKSRLCYPKNGIYSIDSSGRVELCFGSTPASKTLGRVLNGVDTVASVAGLGAGIAGVGAAMFATMLAPVAVPSLIVGGAAGAYGLVRSSVELADRGKHKESLTDRESARHWLSIVGSALGVGSAGGMAMVRFMAQEGIVASKLLTSAVTGLNYSSITVNGAGLAEGVANIIQKRLKNEEVSKMEIAQVVISALFFTHSVVSIKTAGAVYRETQTQAIECHRASLRSEWHRKIFDKMQKKTMNAAGDPVVGRANIIRKMNYISNRNEFFARVLRKGIRRNALPKDNTKFSNLLAENCPQTSSQGIPANTSAASTSQYHQKMPNLFFDILDYIGETVGSALTLNYFLSQIDIFCSKYPYGKQFRDFLYLLIDCYNCRNLNDVIRIIKNLIEFCQDLYQEFSLRNVSKLNSEHCTSESKVEEDDENPSIEKIMMEVMDDVEFAPGAILAIEETRNEPLMSEDVYHFPIDHQSWGANGELSRDDYIEIGMNALGIANVECEDFNSLGNTGVVYFQNHGVVSVMSVVKDLTVIVKTIRFQREN